MIDRARRLVAFPLVLFYAAVLIIGAWPTQWWAPQPLVLAQTASHLVLATLGWPAGETVFAGYVTGQPLMRRRCFHVEALFDDGASPLVLDDDLARCRTRASEILHRPAAVYRRRMLARALGHLRSPDTHRDINAFPLDHFYAIASADCLRAERLAGRRPRAIVYTRAFVTVELATGRETTELVHEGAHHCAEGAWEPY